MVTYLATKGGKKLHIKWISCTEMNSPETAKIRSAGQEFKGI